jgi:hypothetical protein
LTVGHRYEALLPPLQPRSRRRMSPRPPPCPHRSQGSVVAGARDRGATIFADDTAAHQVSPPPSSSSNGLVEGPCNCCAELHCRRTGGARRSLLAFVGGAWGRRTGSSAKDGFRDLSPLPSPSLNGKARVPRPVPPRGALAPLLLLGGRWPVGLRALRTRPLGLSTTANSESIVSRIPGGALAGRLPRPCLALSRPRDAEHDRQSDHERPCDEELEAQAAPPR